MLNIECWISNHLSASAGWPSVLVDLDFQLLIDVYLIQRYRAGPDCLP